MARLARRVLLIALIGASSSCLTGDPASPQPVALEAVVYAGDQQFGEPGKDLPEPLEVLVQKIDGSELDDPVRVTWEIIEGSGAALSAETSFTDDAQRARTRLTLGSEPGGYIVRARFPDVGLAPVEFTVRATVRPTVTSVTPSGAEPGDEVVIEGSDFLSEHGEMTVLFDGIRAETTGGTTTSLTAVVPPCISEGQARITVGVGALASDPAFQEIGASGTPLPLPAGGYHVIDDPSALSCIRIEGGGARYLAVVHSSGTVGVVLHPYSVAFESGEGSVQGIEEWTVLENPTIGVASDHRPARSPQTADWNAQSAWETEVRTLEADALEAIKESRRAWTPPTVGGRPATVATVPPTVGDRRMFDVLDDQGGFTEVEAEARFVGDHAALFVDLNAPEGGFDADDLDALGREFDDPIHPTLRSAFGQESDLDGNERVVILFTPVVNQLTPSGSGSFVGGFFYGVDLLPDRPGSNGGEIFYSLVPDPAGEFGSPRSLDQVLSAVPGILAHEFQHMIHFNQRILLRGAETAEAVWLAEALATTAEHLVGDAYLGGGEEERAQLFWSANLARARRFLEEPSSVSLLISQGTGTVEERGAAWLFLEHLMGRDPRQDQGTWLLTELTRSTRTGVENVTSAFGTSWPELIPQWSAALYLDGLGLDIDSRFVYPTLDLRGTILAPGGYPLRPMIVQGGTEVIASSLPSASALHLLLEPPAGGMAVNLGGASGGTLGERAALGMTLVRLE